MEVTAHKRLALGALALSLAQSLAQSLALSLALSMMAIAALATPARGHAQDAEAQEGEGSFELAGAITTSFLGSDAGYGASAIADIWVPIGPFRIGGAIGAGGLPSDNDVYNRVYMPFALSLALDLISEDGPGLSLRGRAGGWGGATQHEKVTAGGFFSLGAHFAYHLGQGALATIGMDVCFFAGPGEAIVYAPSLGLAFAPQP